MLLYINYSGLSWDLCVFGLHRARLDGSLAPLPLCHPRGCMAGKHQPFACWRLPCTSSQQDTDPTSWTQQLTREAPTPLAWPPLPRLCSPIRGLWRQRKRLCAQRCASIRRTGSREWMVLPSSCGGLRVTVSSAGAGSTCPASSGTSGRSSSGRGAPLPARPAGSWQKAEG